MIRRLKLFWKLALIAVATPAAVVLLTFFALRGSGQLKYQYDNLYGFMLLPIMDIDRALIHAADLSGLGAELSRSDLSPEERAAQIKRLQEVDAALVKLIDKYKKDWITTVSVEFTEELARADKSGWQGDEVRILEGLDRAHAVFVPLRDQLVSGGVVLPGQVRAAIASLRAELEALLELNRRFADFSNENAQVALFNMRRELLWAGWFLSLAAVVAAWLLSHIILKPVSQLTELTQLLAHGDLALVSQRVEQLALEGAATEQGDELAQMLEHFNRFVRELDRVVSTVRTSAGSVATAAAQVSDASQALSRASNEVSEASREQSTGATHISGAMEQLSQSTQRNASSSEELAATARELSINAESLRQIIAFFRTGK